MSQYRIVYTPSAKLRDGGADTTPPVESYDLGQKIRAAIAAGMFAAVATMTVLGILVCLLVVAAGLVEIVTPLKVKILLAAGVAAVSAVMGLLTMCWFGYDWSVQAATRPWVVDDGERARRHELEDAELDAAKAAAQAARKQVTEGDDVDGNPLTLTDGQRLDLVALNMLERVYMYGQPSTRDAMTGDGACIQMEWNLVNAGMKAIGLRQKKTWEPCDFASAWALWRENVRLETHEGARYLMVLKSNGQWHAVERIE